MTQETDKPDQSDLISAVEAAEILGVSRGTVQAWYHKGWLPGYKVGGKTSRLRLYREGVLRFLETSKAASPVSQQSQGEEEA